MPGTIVQPTLTPQTARPNQYTDNSSPSAAPRGSKYNESAVVSYVPTMHMLAEEGSYFTATNPTPGTGVAQALVTSFSSTSGLFAIFNSAPVGGVNIYLDYLRLIYTAVPATAIGQDFVFAIDSTSRAPTAGNVSITPINMNYNANTKAFAQVQAFNGAALTLPASSVTTRNAARVRVATGQLIAGDEIVIAFGREGIAGGQGGNTAVRATDTARKVTNAPPIMVAPQTWLTIHRWWTTETTTAPSMEYELGYYER
jgi:hypothetical protein